MKFFEGSRIPIKSWCNNPEQGAVDQAQNLASLPFAFKHVSLMPDTHQGYGMPIGGVLATKGVVIPNCVGVDIGCGMCAIKTSLKELTTEELKILLGGIRKSIPVGFNRHQKAQKDSLMPSLGEATGCMPSVVCQEYQSALHQLGTLGGGNHFIEIQKGSDGYIWIMLHSGSRNLGYKVARHYNDIAKKLNEKWYSNIPKKYDLAFLPLDSEEAQNYLREMNYCLEFAKANRFHMMNKIKEIFTDQLPDINFDEIINIHHNYATMENHFGTNVVLHRKGATSARKSEIGIIPGSQGTASYIVRGLGNPESFMSCSHGAGRTMSRTKARETLNLEEEVKKMENKGILHSIRGKSSLDEASSSYKDIDVVMEEQKDLVEIVTKLTPLAVVKG